MLIIKVLFPSKQLKIDWFVLQLYWVSNNILWGKVKEFLSVAIYFVTMNYLSLLIHRFRIYCSIKVSIEWLELSNCIKNFMLVDIKSIKTSIYHWFIVISCQCNSIINSIRKVIKYNVYFKFKSISQQNIYNLEL